MAPWGWTLSKLLASDIHLLYWMMVAALVCAPWGFAGWVVTLGRLDGWQQVCVTLGAALWPLVPAVTAYPWSSDGQARWADQWMAAGVAVGVATLLLSSF